MACCIAQKVVICITRRTFACSNPTICSPIIINQSTNVDRNNWLTVSCLPSTVQRMRGPFSAHSGPVRSLNMIKLQPYKCEMEQFGENHAESTAKLTISSARQNATRKLAHPRSEDSAVVRRVTYTVPFQ